MTRAKPMVLFGAGLHAKLVIEMLEAAGGPRLIGLFDSAVPRGTRIKGHAVLGTDEDFLRERRALGVDCGLVAIGDNSLRRRVVERISGECPKFRFISAISPSAAIAPSARIGEGSVVMAGAVVNTDALLGKHCILCVQASVDHDNRLGDFVTLAPGVSTGGCVTIGSGTFVGIRAAVADGVGIGSGALIGAGSTVLEDIPPSVLAYGTPAKVVRKSPAWPNMPQRVQRPLPPARA